MADAVPTAPRAMGTFFLRKFLRDSKNVASVWPSSRTMARAMLRGVELQPGEAIVELGPGTGAFTEEIVRCMHGVDGARYLAIERDRDFLDVLTRRFPALEVVQADAAELGTLLTPRGLRVRAVVSGLPLVAMPEPVVDGMLATIRDALLPGGSFRTFSYAHTVVNPRQWSLRRRMRETFPRFVARGPIVRNVPPAFVFEGGC